MRAGCAAPWSTFTRWSQRTRRSSSWPILSITTFLPVLGILFIAGLNRDDEVAKRAGLCGILTETREHVFDVGEVAVVRPHEQQAASLEETAAAVDEITVTVRSSAR